MSEVAVAGVGAPGHGPDGTQVDQGAKSRRFRVFVSYGHDEYEALAARICIDLDRLGCKAWFDRRDLVGGQAWEAAIETTLDKLASQPGNARMILLMTPHSVRQGSYCRNELQRALDQHVPIIPVMVEDVGVPIGINLLQWVDMRGCMPLGQHEDLYRRQWDGLWRAVQTRAPAGGGEAGRLYRNLAPNWSADRLTFYLPRFTGRDWLWRAMAGWLADPEGEPVFWITGPTGSGKSAIAAWLGEHWPQVRAMHICWHADAAALDPRELVRSLAWQLAQHFDAMREHLGALGDLEMLCREKPAGQLFDRLIAQVANRLQRPASPTVIVIDGLNTATRSETNELARLLGEWIPRLPGWMRFVLTSEDSIAVRVHLQRWAPPVDIGPGSTDNKSDVRAYIDAHIVPRLSGRLVSVTIGERIARASEYNWLYLDGLRADLAAGRWNGEDPERLPRGMGAVYLADFEQRFGEDDTYANSVAPCLSVMLAAPRPLMISSLARLLGRDDGSMRKALGELGAIVVVSGVRVHLYHRALQVWLQDQGCSGRFFVSALDGHRRLADHGWAQFERGVRFLGDDPKRDLPLHLKAIGDLERLQRCITDAGFVGAVFKDSRVFELTASWAVFDRDEHARDELAGLCGQSWAAYAQSGADELDRYNAATGFGQLLQHVGAHRDAVLFLGRALKLATALGDQRTLGFARLNMAWCLRHDDRFQQAIAQARKAAAWFERNGILEGLARADSIAGMCYWHLRDDARALRTLSLSVARFRTVKDSTSEAESLNHLGIIERSTGRYEDALRHLRAALDLHERFKDEAGRGKCLNSLGTLYWWRGGSQRLAFEHYRQANRINKRLDHRYVRCLTANNMGHMLLEQGRAGLAMKAFAFACAMRPESDSPAYRSMDIAGMALAHLRLGHVDEARRLSREALMGLENNVLVEDVERAYFTRYLVLENGTASERSEALRALRKAKTLVDARACRISDPVLRQSFETTVPPVRQVLEAFGHKR